MLATDRSHYAKCNPYMDSPQSIGKFWIFENVTNFTYLLSNLCK